MGSSSCAFTVAWGATSSIEACAYRQARKGYNQTPAPRATPDGRELESPSGRVFLRSWFCCIVGQPARVRGRGNSGASCPHSSLAREAATLSLVTRIGTHRWVDPVGEIAILLFPSWPTPAVFALTPTREPTP